MSPLRKAVRADVESLLLKVRSLNAAVSLTKSRSENADAKSFRRERLRADVLSLASDAMATLRELVSGPDVPQSVRLRASLAILQEADALTVEEIGPTTAESVQTKIEHDAFIESLGG